MHHSGPDIRRLSPEKEIAEDLKRDPLPRLERLVVPAHLSADEWRALQAEVKRDVDAGLTAARARPAPDPARVKRFLFAEPRQKGDPKTVGGLTDRELAKLGGTERPSESGEPLRLAEAIRKTLRHELAVNPKVLVFGEDVGRKGGVHLVTEGLQREFGEARVFDTSRSEEGIIGRAVGMAIAGLMPVAEIQFRKYADPAVALITAAAAGGRHRFACAIGRMQGGVGKAGAIPGTVSAEVVGAGRMASPYPSNRGCRRAAAHRDARQNPPSFSNTVASDDERGSAVSGDDYVLPYCRCHRAGGEPIARWPLARCSNRVLPRGQFATRVEGMIPARSRPGSRARSGTVT